MNGNRGAPNRPANEVSTANLNAVESTLLIPLIARAEAPRRFPYLHFEDPAADAMLHALAVDRRRYSTSRLTMRGSAVRAQAFDQYCREFFARYPDALGISLGAGLCTRFQRIDNGRLRWVDVDLPPVIALKQRLLPPNERCTYLARSVTGPGWLDGIAMPPGLPVIVVAEGLVYYLQEAEVRGLVDSLVRGLPAGSAIVFDYASDWLRRISRFHPALRAAGASFHWSCRGAADVAAWSPRLAVVSDAIPGDMTAGLLPASANRLLRLVTGHWFYAIAYLRLLPGA